ncbi:DNA topoisomerase 2-associated protein pat1, partial [Coemansia helicoidea]
MDGSFFGSGGSSSGLDARLESMALYDGTDGQQLGQDQDTFNAETFEADAREIAGSDFDFFGSTARQQQQQQPVQPVQAAPRKVLTLAELEAQLMPQQRQTPGRAPAVARADPETIARRRAERLQKQATLQRYDNLMTQRDKDYIIRIQVSQLLTDDPAADDFYCHMFQLSRGTAAMPGAGQQQQQSAGDSTANVLREALEQRGMQVPGEQAGEQARGRGRRSNTQSSMARMQQQVQRFVNEARRRPKAPQVAVEGALGKISVNSARNPKQVLQVQRGHSGSMSQHQQQPGGDMRHQSPGAYDAGGLFAVPGDTRTPAVERRKTLQSIETAYGAVLRLEQLAREQARLPTNADHPAVQTWLRAYGEARDQAWAALGAGQPIMNVYPHPLARFLAFSKGKRIIPRVAHHLSIDQ